MDCDIIHSIISTTLPTSITLCYYGCRSSFVASNLASTIQETGKNSTLLYGFVFSHQPYKLTYDGQFGTTPSYYIHYILL